MAGHKDRIFLHSPFRNIHNSPTSKSYSSKSPLPRLNIRMSHRPRPQDRQQGRRRPQLERMDTARPKHDDLDMLLAHPLYRNTRNPDILQDHIVLRGQRAKANLSSGSIDCRLAGSTTKSIQETQRQLTDAEDSTTILPATTYVPSASHSTKGKQVHRNAIPESDSDLNTSSQGTSSIGRRRGENAHQMPFFNIENIESFEDMYEKIDDTKNCLDAMVADFADVMAFLNDHVERHYQSNVETTILGAIDQTHYICDWMRETVQRLERGEPPYDDDSTLKGP